MSGTLFYLIGASGSGKDSLLAGCRDRLGLHQRCCIAHRYITRAPGIGGENHVHLTEHEFQMRAEMGMFSMHWTSHGYSYGIGSEVDSWLESGANVVVNGSRQYLEEAMKRYDSLVPVLVDVDSDLLRQRLQARGRESEDEIEKRLARHTELLDSLPEGILQITNTGGLSQAVDALMDLIDQHTLESSPL